RIEITTESRDPLLPIRLTDIFVMSKSWAEANGVTEPQNILANDETFATNNTNGTGPYKLVSREPGKLTRLVRNDNYWGWNSEELPNRIEEIEYRPIPDDKERITELLQKSVDFVQDVPLSELVVLRQAPAMFMKIGPENRVIFLGLSTQATFAEKPNILADIRVREAISIAVDRRAIQRDIMLGQSIPTGVLAPPGINGFPSELDEIPPRDLDKARALLKAAGIAPDARVTLDCPTNRYVNDAAICQAVARQLGEIGILVTLGLSPKADHFQNLRAGRLQFYLLGWGVPTFDSAYIFTNLFHTRSEKFGTWNGTGYSNADLDKRIEALPQLNEPGARARSMNEIWRDAAAARTYVPIHVQTLIYAMREGVNIDVDISNTPKMKHATVKPPTPN
ncbi:MAG: ABC transporter substrate-binding protein, partial [Alphaproteobacteria bacterium]|nr:ABC transporter substrate-binding protein [Alphaproteobacteria bacterium]